MKRLWILLAAACCLVGFGLSWFGEAKPEAVQVDWDRSIPSLVEEPDRAEVGLDLEELDLGDLISAEVADALVAKELVRRLPLALGTGEQYMVASHLVNVIDENDYAQVAEVITNHEGLESSALDVLLADLHLRDESIKLPTLAKITGNPDHPAFDEAFGSLRTYFEEKGDGLEDWRAAALAEVGGDL